MQCYVHEILFITQLPIATQHIEIYITNNNCIHCASMYLRAVDYFIDVIYANTKKTHIRP